MVNVAILNVKYSPNLGDGLLSECLEAELRAQGADMSVQSIDLAVRQDYGDGGRHRHAIITILEHLPARIRQIGVGIALGRIVTGKLVPQCRAAFARADAIVLGGGNLLTDVDLNFPMKIAGALGVTVPTGKPVGVFGVGVGDHWSRRGAALFAGALRRVRLVHAAVRDERSQRAWAQHLAGEGIRPAGLCRDPGLLTARHFAAAPAPAGKPRIGLGITHPLALRYHGGKADGQLDDWTVALAGHLCAHGFAVAPFTNGSPEDRAHLATLLPRLRAACGADLVVEPGFARPADLARFVSGCALVLAHRMHACIAAYSYAVPHVGFAWDPKLDSFFASVVRSDYMIDPAHVSPEAAAATALRAHREGIDPERHRAVLDEAAADVRALHSDLAKAAAG